jgi:hypothetical protein
MVYVKKENLYEEKNIPVKYYWNSILPDLENDCRY